MKYTLFFICFNDYVLIYCVYLFLDIPRNRKDSGVNFFNHFNKDFICPYGLAHDQSSFDPATFSCRLNNIHCKFYLRPQIAISEFAETVPVNLKYVQENLEILEKDSIDALTKKTKKIDSYRNILDSKQKNKTGMCISFYNNYYIDVLYIILYILLS